MKKIIKLLIPNLILKARNERNEKNQKIINRLDWINHKCRKWSDEGSVLPPPHEVKQLAIIEAQKKNNYSVFVETGTYFGDMIEAQNLFFKDLYSIELGIDLYDKAVKRFEKENNITILQGDSGLVMKEVMKQINTPAIFWLDGHYSAGVTAKGEKECPIFEELKAILEAKKMKHLILIDDARCFVGENDYPTIEELSSYVKKSDPKYCLEIKNDIIYFQM